MQHRRHLIFAMAFLYACHFLLILMLQLTSVLSSSHPCSSYQLIAMIEGFRSSDFYSKDSLISICDAYINPAIWYRFEHDAGIRLIERPVDPWYCGTQGPIWLNGTHPTDAAVKEVQACSSYSLENMCGWSGTVRISSCSEFGSSFFVYQLAAPPGCALAYCVDAATRKQCVPPEEWISDEFRCGVVETSTAASTQSASVTPSTAVSSTTSAGSTDPGWSQWGPWSACSKKCDYGLQSRRRICGQLPCDGPASTSQLCNEYNCQKIAEEENEGIALNLKSFDESSESLFKVVENEQLINDLLRKSLNKLCSQNASLCCGYDYQGSPVEVVEYVTDSDIYSAQGTLHPEPDGTVFNQIIAFVNENVDRTICKGASGLIKERQTRSATQHFIPFETMEVGILDSTDRILQNTGLIIVKYTDPSLIEDDDNNDDNDPEECPLTTCVIPIVMSVLVVVVVAVVGLTCYMMGRSKTCASDPRPTEEPPPLYQDIEYPSSGMTYETLQSCNSISSCQSSEKAIC